ncbi:Catechol 2,3-dioxygenase [Quadrisphaera granulorum]|uniref:Catechol 2,3-dioxygenase-like lactoylglutathione lyase family enzyme n=1 Tax=Quadrisphaera granulorum TaxID=317664 RepID=A0A316A8X0_9ACTN|nr:VOC family protein [Quadrisphaera granulorum]PWJ53658.1 catechol 2,3-dioxygenase-like lactoylglutathione lyase family enzyme [Quadrisphaera granulorum]SZE96702.1 Catechol 2,3-dioxygenase [Quadrisphaera granulorum]
MTIQTTGFSHVRLTVRDIAVSRRFYDRVFGWEVAYELPADADQATRDQLWFAFGGVIYRVPGGLLGLRPVAAGDDSISEDRVGLDHLSFSVGSKADLDAAVAVLDAVGAPHGEVKDAGTMHLLEFRDPDGIALELVAAKG